MTYFPPKPNFGSPTSAERAQMFGTFPYKPIGKGNIRILGNWASENIVKVKIPQLIGVEGAPKDGVIQFHRKGVEQIEGFFDAVESEGLKHLVISWAGSFFPRMVRGSSTALSNHSWGTAFDINAPQNWLNAQPAQEGKKGTLLRLVPIANDFGFFWGGHYRNRLDGMHFELAVLNRKPTKYFEVVKTSAMTQESDVELDLPLPTHTANPIIPTVSTAILTNPVQILRQEIETELNQESENIELQRPQVTDDQVRIDLPHQPLLSEQSAVIPIVAGGGQNESGTLIKKEYISWQSMLQIYWKELAGIVGLVIGFLQENWIYLLIGLGLIALGAWLYNQSKTRADKRQEKQQEIASRPDRINTELI
jgi:hypothetical protein